MLNVNVVLEEIRVTCIFQRRLHITMEDTVDTGSDYNDQHMEAAFAEGRAALEAGEVPIGCCFVLDSEIVARGRNEVNLTKEGGRIELPTRLREISQCPKKAPFSTVSS